MELFWQTKRIVKDLVNSYSWPSRPQKLNFEITSACDARCIHCPRQDMDRPMASMDMGLFEKMIKEAAELRIPELTPNGYGEICTIPISRLSCYFSILERYAKKSRIYINSNGNRLFEEYARLFIEHQVYLINITIDGATANTAESIRIGLNFDQIEKNIYELIALRKSMVSILPKIRVGMVAIPKNIPEIDQFVKKWTGVVEFVGVGGFSNRAASVSADGGKLSLGMVGDPADVRASNQACDSCVLPFYELNIWSDGKAVICCEDWNEENIVGDLNKMTINEIWHSLQLKQVRQKHRMKRGHEIDICSKCNNWRSPSLGSLLWS